MINSIIASISTSLDAEFGFETHMEEIKQGLDEKEPCFFITCLNPTTDLFRGKRYFRQNQFCIQYFPKSDKPQKECNDVAEKLTWCLEYLNIAGEETPMRGTKMKSEVVDGILNFFLNYDCFVYRKEETTAMETLSSDTTVKEGV